MYLLDMMVLEVTPEEGGTKAERAMRRCMSFEDAVV